jgi:hypothetical protein
MRSFSRTAAAAEEDEEENIDHAKIRSKLFLSVDQQRVMKYLFK